MGLKNEEAQIALAILGSSSDEKLISMIKEIGCEHTKEEIDVFRDCLRRYYTCRVTGVNTCFLNVFHDSCNEYIFTVT